MNKNRFSLTKRSSSNGYDWWWHSFVATHSVTGEPKPFFIEYYVINPGLWNGSIIYGQQKTRDQQNIRPCYALLKAGTWGEGKVQLHNFYGIDQFSASTQQLDCRIGPNSLTETRLTGAVQVSETERDSYPERMSDAGSLEWNLTIDKKVKFDVGFGSSALMNLLGAFQMYWHVEGMKCTLQGEILFNNEKYLVHPETSFGYQDKNWGSDYTNPWIWLNCNNFRSKLTNTAVDASLDLGGGCPKIFGISLQRRILTAFFYKGKFIEFNFSKFWKRSRQDFNTQEDDIYFYWNVTSINKRHKIIVHFKCAKSDMLWVNYESPKGEKNTKNFGMAVTPKERFISTSGKTAHGNLSMNWKEALEDVNMENTNSSPLAG